MTQMPATARSRAVMFPAACFQERNGFISIPSHLSNFFELYNLIIKRWSGNGQASVKPAGLLIGFRSEEDWFDYGLEHDPRFF
jgi:hypothetical protein